MRVEKVYNWCISICFAWVKMYKWVRDSSGIRSVGSRKWDVKAKSKLWERSDFGTPVYEALHIAAVWTTTIAGLSRLEEPQWDGPSLLFNFSFFSGLAGASLMPDIEYRSSRATNAHLLLPLKEVSQLQFWHQSHCNSFFLQIWMNCTKPILTSWASF